MALIKAIQKQFDRMQEKGWDKIYWAIDLHDTIIPGLYTSDDDDAEYYPGALEALQMLTAREDCCLILWTSSHLEYIAKRKTMLMKFSIYFDHCNGNPETKSNKICNFNSKFYFNVILDDKAGFDGETDWLAIIELLKARA